MNNPCKFVRNAIPDARSWRFLIGLALALLLGSAAHAQSGGLKYHLTDLQSSFRSKVAPNLSVAYAINEAGQITGDLIYGNNQYCFIYTPGRFPGTTFTSSAASTLWCDAHAINSAGWVTGSIYMPNAGLVNAFLRSPSSGEIKNYPSTGDDFSGGIPYNSFGWGIDDSLNVVGEMDGFFPDTGYIFQAAYSWNSAGTPIPLYPPPYPYYSQELATSGSGAYVAVDDVWQYEQSVLWPNGAYLNAFCGYWDEGQDLSAAYAVNNQGHAAGTSFCGYTTDPENLYNHATFWGSQGVVDLGFQPSTAYAISSDDWVVGHSGAWSGGAGDAFLRVSDPHCPTMVNLNLLLDAASTGWKVVQAYGINTAHQIVGQAADSTGKMHASCSPPTTISGYVARLRLSSEVEGRAHFRQTEGKAENRTGQPILCVIAKCRELTNSESIPS